MKKLKKSKKSKKRAKRASRSKQLNIPRKEEPKFMARSTPPECNEERPIDPRLRFLFWTVLACIFLGYIGFDFINRGTKIKNANETIVSCSKRPPIKGAANKVKKCYRLDTEQKRERAGTRFQIIGVVWLIIFVGGALILGTALIISEHQWINEKRETP